MENSLPKVAAYRSSTTWKERKLGILNYREKKQGVPGLKIVRVVMQASNSTSNITAKNKQNISLPKVDQRMNAFQSYSQMREGEYGHIALEENYIVTIFLQQRAMKYII